MDDGVKKTKCEGEYCTCSKSNKADDKKKLKEQLMVIDGQVMPEDPKVRLTKTWVPVNQVCCVVHVTSIICRKMYS